MCFQAIPVMETFNKFIQVVIFHVGTLCNEKFTSSFVFNDWKLCYNRRKALYDV